MTDDALKVLLKQRDNWADTTVPGIAVRVQPAQWTPAENRFIGWNRYLNSTYRDEAIRQVWGVRDAHELVGAAFVVALGGWIAEVRSITYVEDVPGGRAFTLGNPTTEQRVAYEGKRLPPSRGRQVIRLGAV
ncbi:hypothetical protein GS896_25740 [Rhodococcus hoagii]|nr:hypothetical protein [Prescottella equi]MBM4719565.1 hypothetical protein [Prescottella equi]NKR23364.1 hypothetical protein [Prescottella equi]NKT56025.1 hypothetical protein [Prescottella equi]NKU37351.1 hypothetical protein [Prescottella equi]